MNAWSIKESRAVGVSHGLCEARARYIRVTIWYTSAEPVASVPELAEAGMIGRLSSLLSSPLRRSWYSTLRLLGSHGSSNVSHASESRFNIAYAGFGGGGA